MAIYSYLLARGQTRWMFVIDLPPAADGRRRHAEGGRGGRLHEAAEALDRAARLPYGRIPPHTPRAVQLRAVARLLAVAGRLADDKALLAALRLIVELSLLADALAELRESQRRVRQVRAARTAARLLREAADAPAGSSPSGIEAGTSLTSPLTGPATRHGDARRQAPRAATGQAR